MEKLQKNKLTNDQKKMIIDHYNSNHRLLTEDQFLNMWIDRNNHIGVELMEYDELIDPFLLHLKSIIAYDFGNFDTFFNENKRNN